MTPTWSKKYTPPSRFKSSLKLWMGVPFVLILVLAIILSQIDLESVKENLIQRVSDETGLKVEIGSIGFGFSRGLGLQCKNVKVSTPEGDHYSVDRLDLLAAWSPLLKGEFKIKSAALEHPVIKLEIPESSQPPAKKQQPPAEKEKDEPTLVAPETIQSATKKLESTPLSVDEFIISDGKITLTRSGKQLPLNVDGNFNLNQGESLGISAKAVKIQTGSIILEADGMASNLTADNAGISMNLTTGGFSLKEIQPILQFFGRATQETPLESVDLDHLLLKAAFPLNSLTQVEELKKQMVGEIELKIRNAVLKVEDRYTIESLEGKGSWNNGVLDHNFSGRILESDFSINGKLPFANLEKDSNSRIEWKNLDVTKLPLPEDIDWHVTEGMMAGMINLTGPLPAEGKSLPGKLKGSLKFDAQNLKIQGKGSPPILLTRLEGDGNIANNRINYKIKSNAFSGTIASDGKISLGSKNPVLNNTIELANLDLSQLPLATIPKKGTVSATIKLKGPLPEPEDILTGKLNIDTKFKITNLNILAGVLPLNIQKFEGKTTLKQGKLTHDLNGTLFGGSIKTKGNLSFSKNKAQTLITANSNLSLDKVSLDWVPMIQKSEWAPSSGTLTGNLNIKGPLPSDNAPLKIKLKGNLEGNKLVFGKPERTIDKIKLNFKESATALFKTEITAEKIQIDTRRFKKALALVNFSPEKTALIKADIRPLNGRVQLAGSFLPKSGDYKLRFKGEKLQVQELVLPNIVGPLEFSGKLRGTLPSETEPPGLPAFARNLSGNMKINLVDGSIPELGVLDNLLSLLNLNILGGPKKAGLVYDFLRGDFKIQKGVVDTKNLKMNGPQLKLYVTGQSDLVKDSIDAEVKALPLGTTDKLIKNIPGLGDLLRGGEKGGVIEIYVKVDGKLSNPDYTPLPHKTLLEKPKDAVKSLANIIQKGLGGNIEKEIGNLLSPFLNGLGK